MEKELKEVSQSLEKADIKAQGIKFEPDDALKLPYWYEPVLMYSI